MNESPNKQDTNSETHPMSVDTKIKLIKICEQVAADMENDAKEMDGMPFDGKTVATYFGYQGAAIKALADAIKRVVELH